MGLFAFTYACSRWETDPVVVARDFEPPEHTRTIGAYLGRSPNSRAVCTPGPPACPVCDSTTKLQPLPLPSPLFYGGGHS